jgi:ribosome-associated protein
MIVINDRIFIDEGDLSWDFIRSSGPGGQHINKASTAVQLRFDLRNASGLPQDVKRRIILMSGSRLSNDGVLIITARRFRSQDRNRTDALERLKEIILKAATPPRRRIRTRPSCSEREERLRDKKLRGAMKKARFRKVCLDE